MVTSGLLTVLLGDQSGGGFLFYATRDITEKVTTEMILEVHRKDLKEGATPITLSLW